LWHLSLCAQLPQGPLEVLRWSPTRWRQMQALRDRLMFGCGTDEPWYLDELVLRTLGAAAKAVHWRKPLAIPEINQMAPTPEVRARQGRP